MTSESAPRRLILTHAGREAFDDMTRTILARLGYPILTPEEFAERTKLLGRLEPEMRIVDERHLAEIPEDGYPDLPIVVLAGRHGVTGVDPRIAGAVRRPAGMHELYRLIQEVLEETPRTTPRTPTHLPAHCEWEGKDWTGTILSISESGCLFRSAEPQMLGARFNLEFSLPSVGSLELEADVAYQLIPELGLVFQATRPSERAMIAKFIERTLAAG
jgi:hypothetical protein